jgi:hypothetical protein
MTPEKLPPDNQPSGITLPMFIGAAVVVIGAAMAAVWFAFPAPDTTGRVVSLSGTKVLELGELCGETQCSRVAILDVTQPDGTHIRTGCPLDHPGNKPLFVQMEGLWSPEEDSIGIAYVMADGTRGDITIATKDCTLTQ